MECAALSSFLVTLPFEGIFPIQVLESAGIDRCAISCFRQQTWQELQNSNQSSSLACGCGNRFSDFQAWRFVPGVMCRPSGCDYLWCCWRPISLSFEQDRPGHARHLVG